jgi:hypothetical protein
MFELQNFLNKTNEVLKLHHYLPLIHQNNFKLKFQFLFHQDFGAKILAKLSYSQLTREFMLYE